MTKFHLEPTTVPDLFTVEGEVDVAVGPGEIAKFPIDLGETQYGTNATPHQVSEAFDIIMDKAGDPRLGTSGRRNDDAVNLCIAAHVLGFDALHWIEALTALHLIDTRDANMFMDHVYRVSGYLGSWGPSDDLGRALEKTI